MTLLEIIGVVIAGITSLITGFLGYRQHQLGQELEKKKEGNSKEKEFINDLLDRVDKLETRQDLLQDKITETAIKTNNERRILIEDYEKRAEMLRKEMHTAIGEAKLEVSNWRDKYLTLIEDYQRLRLEYAAIKVQFTTLEKEYHELKALYDASTKTLTQRG